MSQQTGKYILKKCISCGEIFAHRRYGKQVDLCKNCRKHTYKKRSRAEARQHRDAYLAERDAKAPAVAVTVTTRRNSLGATFICETRGRAPAGNRCTFNRY